MRTQALLVVMASLPALAAAQVPNAPEDFGTEDESITMVSHREFFPRDPSDVYHGDDWGRWSDSSLDAPINGLPNGVLLTQVAFYLTDESAVADFAGYLCFNRVDSLNPDVLLVSCQLGTVESSGTPGRVVLAFAPNQRIQYRQGDLGTADLYNYFLRVRTDGDEPVQIHMVRLRWRREVSPAPQSATFADVPTNHQFFQWIEALSASGITAGCDDNPPLFCPDRNLTRGEMAVFLSKALGLHWPWDAP
jgi:hypothetical protein